ncbi:Fic family protein [bacterium]|nr:Fic family protein [bacterium]MBU1958767.1 Fic family protein [bacterium]
MSLEKKWIWEHEGYPNFRYNQDTLIVLLQEIKYHQGLLDGIYSSINDEDLGKAQIEVFTQEAMDTSEIEGEILNRDSVRSSLSNKFRIDIGVKDSSNRVTDGLVEVLIDAVSNLEKPLDENRLFSWHRLLFPQNENRLIDIHIGAYRTEEMEIVSGAMTREKVHYVAPPPDTLKKDMGSFLTWLNQDDATIVKAAIAHLWFVIIHPMDDGNGRIARAISDWVLAKEVNKRQKLYSLSSAIKNERKAYYEILEKTTKGDPEITAWIAWFLETFLQALKDARESIKFIVAKTAFWDRHRGTVLNERQIKILNRLLDVGYGNFEGGINTRKYASLAKVSKPTASRELKDLVEKGCLVQKEGTSGRSIAYEVKYYSEN